VVRTWANPPTVPPVADPLVVASPRKKRRMGYRAIILLVTLGLFFMVIAGSSLYLYFGNNQISSKNIALTTSGALTVGGGEVFPIEVTIVNNNKVPIESAVLIVNFPSGTKSAEENTKDMLEERILVNQLKAGETLKVPLKAIIFGEENQEHTIKTTLEYRLQDSPPVKRKR
jgi:hypothetical protein